MKQTELSNQHKYEEGGRRTRCLVLPSLYLEHTAHDRSTCDASAQLVYLCARLVDVEGANDDEAWGGCEVSHGDGDVLGDVLADHVDVQLQLRADGDDRRALSDGACERDTSSIASLSETEENPRESEMKRGLVCAAFHLL